MITTSSIAAPPRAPASLDQISIGTEGLGFPMASEPKVGSLLRALIASKRSSRVLELGTGTGYGTAWMLDGMDEASRLDSVDTDAAAMAIARAALAKDPRVSFHLEDGIAFLARSAAEAYDVVFADAWPGKYQRFDLTLRITKRSGIIVLDDMLPQANWPEGHQKNVDALLAAIRDNGDLHSCCIDSGTGMVLVVKG